MNITKSREIINFVNRLKFEFFKITALKQYSNFTDSTAITENNKFSFVTTDSEEIIKERFEILRVQSYKENRKFLFITYLHNDKNEQFKKITFFFRLKFVYLNFYDVLN